MTVYAIFLCLQAAASCQPAQAPYIDSFGDLHQMPVYQLLADCQHVMLVDYAGRDDPTLLDEQGRYVMASGVVYECRHRHVDTWESQ